MLMRQPGSLIVGGSCGARIPVKQFCPIPCFSDRIGHPQQNKIGGDVGVISLKEDDCIAASSPIERQLSRSCHFELRPWSVRLCAIIICRSSQASSLHSKGLESGHFSLV